MLTRAVIEEYARTGEFPHEILLRICQGRRIGKYRPTRKDRLRAAKAAAPYYAPRLRATVAVPNVQSDVWAEIVTLVEGEPRSQAAASG